MGIWQDLKGTTLGYLRLGIGGVRLKNNGGNLAVRNSGDTADASVTASTINVSGDGLTLNSDAANSGSDWPLVLQRAVSGMAQALTLVFPNNYGSPGQVLGTDGAGNLNWVSAASTASCDKIDTTQITYGSTSPVALFTTGAGDVIDKIQIVVDTAFNGSPSMSVGISGTTSKYMASTDLDLTQPAGTVFEVHPGKDAAGSAESLIATFSGGGATAGSARILVYYGTPA